MSKLLLVSIRNNDEDFPEGYLGASFNTDQLFGGIVRTMVTLFNISLLNNDWDTVGRAVVERQPHLIPFFLIFIVFTTFGVMNVIIGVIVDNTMEAAKSNTDALEKLQTARHLEFVERVRKACFLFDADGSGEITRKELSRGLRSGDVAEALQQIPCCPLSMSDDEFFDIVDCGGQGKITERTFMKSLVRCMEQSPKQSLAALQLSLNGICKILVDQHGEHFCGNDAKDRGQLSPLEPGGDRPNGGREGATEAERSSGDQAVVAASEAHGGKGWDGPNRGIVTGRGSCLFRAGCSLQCKGGSYGKWRGTGFAMHSPTTRNEPQRRSWRMDFGKTTLQTALEWPRPECAIKVL